MDTIDWKKKLTSRKFWVSICSLVTNLIIAFGGTEDTTVRVAGIIMAGATVIAYIIGEGLVDAANAGVVEVPVEIEEYEDDDGESEGPGLEG